MNCDGCGTNGLSIWEHLFEFCFIIVEQFEFIIKIFIFRKVEPSGLEQCRELQVNTHSVQAPEGYLGSRSYLDLSY